MNEALVVAAAVVGALFGFAADRVSVRWPEHEPDYRPRRIDWRTAVVALTAGIVAAGLAARPSGPQELVVLVPFACALIVLLATDLDQKMLPDVVTLPLIVFAAAVLVTNWSPALAGKEFGLASGLAAGIGAPLLLFVSDRILGGDLGLGDIKLSASLGLMFGVTLLFYGLLVASVGFAVVLVALIAAHRIGLRSAVPFGPVLIFGAFVAVLLG